MKNLDLSIILPTYNESKNIIPLVEEIQRQLKDKPIKYEIIVSDDDSPDKTWEIVNKYSLKPPTPQIPLIPPFIHVLHRLLDHSLARSILEGINNAQGKNIVIMDSDFNHDPKLIWQMVELLENYDAVIGSRFLPGGGMEDDKRNKLSFLFNLFIRILLGTHIQDNTSGYIAIKKEMLMPFATKEIFDGYGEYFMRVLYRARHKKYKMIEVPVFYNLRLHGNSKSNFFKMALTYSLAAINELKNEVKQSGSLKSIFNR